MDHKEQQAAYLSALEAVTERFCKEFDLTYCQAIGCLELHKSDLLNQATDTEDED